MNKQMDRETAKALVVDYASMLYSTHKGFALGVKDRFDINMAEVISLAFPGSKDAKMKHSFDRVLSILETDKEIRPATKKGQAMLTSLKVWLDQFFAKKASR